MRSTGLLLAFGLCSTTIAAPMEWANTDGKVITGEFIRVKGDSVVISKGGKSYTIPFAKLSPESVEQAKRMGASQTPVSPREKIDISPTNLLGKPIKELEKILGTPSNIVSNWEREYKPAVKSVSRVIIKSINMQNPDRKTFTLNREITYCFPKNLVEEIPEALNLVGIESNGWNKSHILNDNLGTKQIKAEGYHLWWQTASSTVRGLGVQNTNEDALIVKELFPLDLNR